MEPKLPAPDAWRNTVGMFRGDTVMQKIAEAGRAWREEEELETLYWINLSYACFGLVAQDGRVTFAPPIAKWTQGKPVGDALNFYRKKGAKIRTV